MTNVEGKSDRNSFKVSAMVDPNTRSDSYSSRPSQTLHTIRHDLPHSQYSVLYNTQILCITLIQLSRQNITLL
jgi:hypothetical protein